MLTKIFFVRHAHSSYTPDELGRSLSEQGLTYANSITQVLKKENIDYVISSPYQRAIQTVIGVAELIGKEVIIENDLKERNLSDSPVEDFMEAVTKVWREPAFSWDGGESNVVAQERGVQAILKILERYPGKNIVVGTHGNIMVLIMNYFNKNYGFDFWKKLKMPDIYKLTFDKKELKEVKRMWSND